LPTFDEAVGRDRLSPEAWNTWLLAQLNHRALNVLTIHAEVEGIAYAALFDDFLLQAHARGVRFTTLGALVPPLDALPEARIIEGAMPGRDGLLALQSHISTEPQRKVSTR
jgi:undecaprenyl phosphate-alpha-L-ara4FN deformylase